MQHLSSAFGASEALRHEIEYDPTLTGAELLATVRALLATRRHAEQLICRYLADLADRVQEQGDEWLGARVQSVGGVTSHEPVEDVARRHLGLARRNTLERIRVGRALRALPQVECAFIEGELSYSRVREVTRIATATTEVVWLELARTLDMRTLERRVALANAEGDSGEWRDAMGAPDRAPATAAERLAAATADGAVHDATSVRPRERTVNGEVLGVDAANDFGLEGDCEPATRAVQVEAGAAYARGEDPREGRARAHANVEWTHSTMVRVTLELTSAAWALLQPAVDAALRESAATLHAGERLDAVVALAPAAKPRQADAGEPPLGAAPPLASESAQAGVALAPHLGIVAATAWDVVDGVRAPRGVSRAVASGATHLGISNPSAMDSVGAIDAPNMSQHVEVGGTHVAKNLPIARDLAAHARVTGELVAMGGTGTSAGSVEGNKRERGPTRAPLPGIDYAPAARVLEVMGERGGWSVDSLVDASGFLVQQVNAALIFLTLDGYVRQRAGRFVRC
jgi:DprA/Smf-like nucleotide binding protein involved in DNA uptake